MQFLRSIPGIGFITAITILASIGDPGLLRNPRELAAFTGLVPSEYSTGERITKGRITQLQQNKKESKTVSEGNEAGLKVETKPVIQVGDEIVAAVTEIKQRTLQS